MPQLEFHLFPMQLFWLAVTFVLLYVVMAKIALPRIGSALDARAAKIDGDLAAATMARDQARALLEAHDKRIAQALQASRDLLRDAHHEMAAVVQKHDAEIAAELGAKAKAADQQITETKQKALSELGAVAEEAVAQIVRQLLDAPADAGEIKDAVAQSIGGLKL